jgi:hypothetical protein
MRTAVVMQIIGGAAMMRRLLPVATIVVIANSLSPAQVPYALTPDWVSTDITNYSTGAAWADMNQDGWLDLVVANGNDMARQRLVVYYNTGAGSLPTSPNWQSSDIDYHGHLAIGDVNGDGYPDVAVSVYIGAAGFSQKGRVKLYLNNNGTLASSPSWISKDSMYTFSCAFGDADGDGDLDLAVACGESYNTRSEKNRIYYNTGGVLDSLPGWMTQQAGYSYDVTWADCDNDGDLDLVFANERGPNHIYRNTGTTIETSPIWASTDPSQFANSLFVADVNNDGWLDLAVSDNNQTGGTGRFKIYLNSNGTMSSTPFWSSAFSGYGSGIALADIDNDGDRDLVTGGWWQPCRIYLNTNGSFNTTPEWTSTSSSVVEAIVFGDVDNDALDTTIVTFVGNGSRKLFYLPRSPVHRIASMVVGPDTLTTAEYCHDLENGWISLANAPLAGIQIRVQTVASRDLDFAVSNWDNNKGNYLFKNLLNPVFVAEQDTMVGKFTLHQNFPNPFNGSTTIAFTLPVLEAGGVPGQYTVSLKVFDLLGREVGTLMDDVIHPGAYRVTFTASDLASGTYFYRLQAGQFVKTKRFLIVK